MKTVSQIAKQFGLRPRTISDLFYHRLLDTSRCTFLAGCWLVPDDYCAEVGRIATERQEKAAERKQRRSAAATSQGPS